MTDANDAFTVAERYRPTAINNVRSKLIMGVVYFNSRCARTVPSALAELLVVNLFLFVFLITDAGAWLLEYDAEQHGHLKVGLHSKPQTFEDIRNRRIKAEKDGTSIKMQHSLVTGEDKVLDGFFLVNSCNYFSQNKSKVKCQPHGVVQIRLKFLITYAYKSSSKDEIPERDMTYHLI